MDSSVYMLVPIPQLSLLVPLYAGKFVSLKKVFERKFWEGVLLPSMLKICSPIVPAFSSRSASSETLKKCLSVGILAIALISFIKFLVSRAFLFKYPRTLETEERGEGHQCSTLIFLLIFSRLFFFNTIGLSEK